MSGTGIDLAAPPSGQAFTAAVVAGATVLYLGYHLGHRLPRFAGPKNALVRRAFGVVLLGLVPALAIAPFRPLGTLGLNLDHAGFSLLVALATWVALVPILYIQARRPAFRDAYPELRVPFTPAAQRVNALSWTLYLFAYELFFRGLLLFVLAHALGPWPALAIVTMAYVFVHLDKYPGEAIGTLVSGAGFGLVALHTGSMLMPFVAHLLIALTTDTLAARASRVRATALTAEAAR